MCVREGVGVGVCVCSRSLLSSLPFLFVHLYHPLFLCLISSIHISFFLLSLFVLSSHPAYLHSSCLLSFSPF